MNPKTIALAMFIGIATLMAGCSGSEKPSEPPATVSAPPTPVPAPAAPSNLKQIQEKKSGDFLIVLLNESGSLKMGANNLVLEFRKGDQLADPGNVQIKPMMEMKGMAPMQAASKVEPAGTPGRYNVTTDLAMAGAWKIMVTFTGGETEFDLKTE